MICPNCNGKGKTTEYDGLRKFWCDYKCEMCNGTGEVMTEQEWLQTCNTEQLAEFLFDIGEYDWLENIADEYKKSLRLKQEVCDGIVEWLKQPHTTE